MWSREIYLKFHYFDSDMLNPMVDEFKECCNSRNRIKIYKKKLLIIHIIVVFFLSFELTFEKSTYCTYKVKHLLSISNRLFELSERYVRAGLSHSVPLVVRLEEEYRECFESRYIEYPTPLCICCLVISSFFPELSNI
ncbi:hypothetical protein BpHYR1_007971 [Brachionus plicatilis]|uniref:Uncharacterized protein n=1 Tax=Brachionus plicatilis TaxID=10195 RepID=A0A3M7RAX6_BRAPC|nr:hypothetical protein BpHYR1_007971 [Brachionus plicatilis]